MTSETDSGASDALRSLGDGPTPDAVVEMNSLLRGTIILLRELVDQLHLARQRINGFGVVGETGPVASAPGQSSPVRDPGDKELLSVYEFARRGGHLRCTVLSFIKAGMPTVAPFSDIRTPIIDPIQAAAWLNHQNSR